MASSNVVDPNVKTSTGEERNQIAVEVVMVGRAAREPFKGLARPLQRTTLQRCEKALSLVARNFCIFFSNAPFLPDTRDRRKDTDLAPGESAVWGDLRGDSTRRDGVSV
jgi:hypothetical protein